MFGKQPPNKKEEYEDDEWDDEYEDDEWDDEYEDDEWDDDEFNTWTNAAQDDERWN